MHRNESIRNETPLPEARVAPASRGWSLIWTLPIIAVLFATWLMVDHWREYGSTIELHFNQGHGIEPGDDLRYRGIQVGVVERVELTPNLDTVLLSVRLNNEANDLARQGSRFWIVRPRFELAAISGLDTVVGDNYVNVLPGDGPAHFQFVGLDQPPPIEAIEPGGLEIVLTTPGKGSLKVGAPITYREVIIGTLIDVDLAKDATAVEAHAYIGADYVNLIRDNVKFWRASGARVNAGLNGLEVDIDSVHSLILGGINVAIPPRPGERVANEARFALYDRPQSEWLSWVPGLSLSGDTTGIRLPQLISAEQRSQYRNWYYRTQDRVRRAWLIALDNGVWGPADILSNPSDALDNTTRLRIDGRAVYPGSRVEILANGLAWLPFPDNAFPTWPLARVRAIDTPENVLVINGDRSPRYIGLERIIARDRDPWPLDESLPFDPSWHGSAVLAESDGALIGQLLVNDDGVFIARWPSDAGHEIAESAPSSTPPADSETSD